jgi:hypothetical protein
MHVIRVPLSALGPGHFLATPSASRGRLTSAELRAPVPSSRTIAKRPTRMIISVVVFAVGLLMGAGIAALVMPPA